ncbi:MAG: ribonuclease P protein component [Thomasclavelia sp.]|nr:ribonuclease P protein component [Thomasclavelia sp.]
MKKEYRVKKNEDFSKIISKKKSVANKSFIIYYLNNNLDHGRVGISVSKKLGNAVVRNKIKRQVRMMIQDVFDLNKSIDYVVIMRNNYLHNSYSVNKDNLLSLYNKLLKRKG